MAGSPLPTILVVILLLVVILASNTTSIISSNNSLHRALPGAEFLGLSLDRSHPLKTRTWPGAGPDTMAVMFTRTGFRQHVKSMHALQLAGGKFANGERQAQT